MSTPKQKQAIQQPIKISASEPSNSSTQNSPFLLPRPIKLTEQHPSPSFSLFDDFTFSLPPPTTQEDQGWTASFEQLPMETANQNRYQRDGWIDDFAPRFSNLNLEGEESRSLYAEPSKIGVPKDSGNFTSMLQDKGFPGRGKMLGSINPPTTSLQPMIWPEKGFPFHQQEASSSVVPNSLQCGYSSIPGICVIPQQMPYVEPWPLENRPFYGYNQHHSMPASCPLCIEAYAHSNVYRMPESCNLNCCNQQECSNMQNDSEDQQQSETIYQPQGTFKGRRQKSKAAFEKPKSARKIQPVLKMNQRPRINSENQEISEQKDFVSKPVEQIPKGARPILSARK